MRIGAVQAGGGNVAGDDDRALEAAGLKSHRDNIQRRDEGEAGLIDVERPDAGLAETELVLNDHGRARDRLLHHRAGADQDIEIAVAPAGHGDGFARRRRAHGGAGFVLAGNAAHTNAEFLFRPSRRLAEERV